MSCWVCPACWWWTRSRPAPRNRAPFTCWTSTRFLRCPASRPTLSAYLKCWPWREGSACPCRRIETGASKPGTFYVLDEHAIPPVPGVSSHSLGIFEVLAVARRLGLPVPAECVILAVEVADCTTVGGSMHPDVAAAIPVVLEWIGHYLAAEPVGAV